MLRERAGYVRIHQTFEAGTEGPGIRHLSGGVLWALPGAGRCLRTFRQADPQLRFYLYRHACHGIGAGVSRVLQGALHGEPFQEKKLRRPFSGAFFGSRQRHGAFLPQGAGQPPRCKRDREAQISAAAALCFFCPEKGEKAVPSGGRGVRIPDEPAVCLGKTAHQKHRRRSGAYRRRSSEDDAPFKRGFGRKAGAGAVWLPAGAMGLSGGCAGRSGGRCKAPIL